jgi:hypothetical protein
MRYALASIAAAALPLLAASPALACPGAAHAGMSWMPTYLGALAAGILLGAGSRVAERYLDRR